jgi:hypothetical protein
LSLPCYIEVNLDFYKAYPWWFSFINTTTKANLRICTRQLRKWFVKMHGKKGGDALHFFHHHVVTKVMVNVFILITCFLYWLEVNVINVGNNLLNVNFLILTLVCIMWYKSLGDAFGGVQQIFKEGHWCSKWHCKLLECEGFRWRYQWFLTNPPLFSKVSQFKNWTILGHWSIQGPRDFTPQFFLSKFVLLIRSIYVLIRQCPYYKKSCS